MKISLEKIRLIGFTLILVGSALAQAKQLPPKNVISMEAARKTVTDSIPGKIQGEELEYEGGKWIYSFDLKSASDSKIHEIHIDAITGKIAGSKIESPADEAKEKQHDEETEKD